MHLRFNQQPFLITAIVLSSGFAAGLFTWLTNGAHLEASIATPVLTEDQVAPYEGIQGLTYYPTTDLQIWAEQDYDDNGLVIAENADGSKGFQITTEHYEATEVLTPETIRAMLPDMRMEKTFMTSIRAEPDNSPVPAVAFYSENEMGETFEVWSVRRQRLYQIVTYRRLDTWLQALMSRWHFIPLD